MKLKNVLKKVGILAMAGAMLIPSIGSAFAAEDEAHLIGNDTISIDRTGSLSLYKYDYTAIEKDGVNIKDLQNNWQKDSKAEERLKDYVIKDVEFSHLKVADIVQDESVNKTTKLQYKLEPSLAKIMGLSAKELYDSTELNAALDNVLKGEVEKNTKAKNQFERYIEKAKMTRMPLTDSKGFTKTDGMKVGLYLVVETKVPANVHSTVNPFLVSIPTTVEKGENWFYDVTAYPKNETDIPTIDKQVRQADDVTYGFPEYKDTATVSTGENADYITLSRLPKITSEASYLTKYTFVDKAQEGLKYNKDVQISFYDSKEDAYADNKDKAILKFTKDDYKQEYSENQMTVSMTKEGLAKINNAMSEKYMVVSYSMELTATAKTILGDKGNTNDVKLEWRRTSEGNYDTLEARARVYAYGIDLTKEFTKSSKYKFDYSKVQFTIKNMTNDHYLALTANGDGKYFVNDKVKTKNQKEAGVFTVGKDGKLFIEGLEADQYEIMEVHTSDGYQLLKKPIIINIKETKDEFTPTVTTHYDIKDIESNPNKNVIELKGDRASATVNSKRVEMLKDTEFDSLNAVVPMTVINTPNVIPPMTGDTGRMLLTGLGILTLGLSAILLRKMKSDEK